MTSSPTLLDPSLVALAKRFRAVRGATESLCRPLETEDYVVQSMPDASPTRWHLAHTSWFFETLVLKPAFPDYEPLDERFDYLFNSYYNTIGAQFPRPQRGMLTRPTVAEVHEYRAHVDRHVLQLLEGSEVADVPVSVVDVGLHHEQQHQELIVTDLKHLLSMNPIHPVYRESVRSAGRVASFVWHAFPEGLVHVGYDGQGFAYDNERPRHRTFVERFELASRPVTCGEYLAFMHDGGYHRPEWWLSAGFTTASEEGWTAPLYWVLRDGRWMIYTLGGLEEIDESEPVCHVSYYEADAYARWAGVRLPTEAEWETAAAAVPVRGHFVEDRRFHPAPAPASGDASHPVQLFGDVWEWTRSPYTAYPGFRPPDGALGEYNAKFMSGQMVLRGGSCATPRSHIRPTYRNFFQPEARWQFSGIRLARDA